MRKASHAATFPVHEITFMFAVPQPLPVKSVMSKLSHIPPASPFHPENAHDYAAWRARKLAMHPREPQQLVVPLADPARPSARETAAIAAMCARANMAIYDTGRREGGDSPHLPEELKKLAAHFGLTDREQHRSMREHELVDIRVAKPEERPRQGFIPYTTRRILWHTDGYYKFGYPGARPIRAMILHCVRDAKEGGENELLDPDIAYIRLRDESPALIAALMRDNAMTIPAFEEEDGSVRPESRGPVFWVDEEGALNMRYTERSRNIEWADDPDTRAAVEFLRHLLHEADEPFRFTVRMKPGQGLLCNNVLHTRSAFIDHDDPARRRLLYRGRYANRIRASEPALSS